MPISSVSASLSSAEEAANSLVGLFRSEADEFRSETDNSKVKPIIQK